MEQRRRFASDARASYLTHCRRYAMEEVA